MIISRRKLIGGVGLLIAAPAIVRAESLMRIKEYKPTFDLYVSMWPGGLSYLRGGIIAPDGTIRTGPEYKDRYTEWRTPDHLTWINPAYKRMVP